MIFIGYATEDIKKGDRLEMDMDRNIRKQRFMPESEYQRQIIRQELREEGKI